jgi:tetratricopeptide (TPR) repeat protein
VKSWSGQLIDKLYEVAAGRQFYLLLGVIFVFALAFRVLYPTADPPVGITRSQDFSTDPFQYVYFAENSVDKGVANPYDDPSYGQWRHTSQNLVAILFFNVFGTGRAAGNAVSTIFSLSSLLLLALAIKNFGSRLGALLFAFIAAFDFTSIWFGRTPFLEASQNFWLCGAVFLFSCRDRHWMYLAGAGLACACASFYAKMIAVFMLGTFGILWILLYLNEEDRQAQLKSAIRFYAGYALGVVSWLLLVYLPVQRQLSGYLSEQAIGLYGAPKALDSVRDFSWQFVSLLWEHEFFIKMPVVTILAYLFGAGVLMWFFAKRTERRLFDPFNPGWVILSLWFALGYFLLFPWNYRPLRYQTTLMLPAMAMAGLALDFVLSRARGSAAKMKAPGSERHGNTILFVAVMAIWLLPLLSLVFLWLASLGSGSALDSIRTNALPFTLVMLLLSALAAVIVRRTKRVSQTIVTAGATLSALLILFLLVSSVVQYIDWCKSRQYSLITADRDLAAILNSSAVIAGPYGPALTQENRLGRIFHMFGTTQVNKDYFARYPVTHLVLDEGNEKRAREDYPDLMGKADLITRYIIRGVPVRLYRISGVSPNADSRLYEPSDFERAQYFIELRNNDSALVYMQRYLASGTPNYSANLYAADALYAQGRYADALTYYFRVQQFSPRDAMSAFSIANCYMATASSATGGASFDSALVYYKIAQSVFSDDTKLAETIKGLERRRK